jgi:tRNA1(Val) A37 N6-methylase TrmN6
LSLFQKVIVKKYLKNLSSDLIDESYKKYSEHFNDFAMAERVKVLKEEQYQEGFLRDLFVKCLGYTINPYENFNLTTEFKNKTDAEKADGAILKDNKPIAVIELKSTKTKDLKTIEKQAFNYKAHQSNCNYVITSNFEKIRLYINDATEFKEFNVFQLSKDDFKYLYLCFSKDSIFEDVPAKIKEKSNQHEEQISKKLYNDYSNFRNKIFQNLTKNNPQIDKLILFKKSQKLLDRFLFIFFAEDKGLIPANMISKIIEEYNKLKEMDHYTPLFSEFKRFFGYINKGNSKYKIDEYNGGLFQFDEILDNVKIEDNVLIEDSLKLSNYDFDSEVDVNILGHIFEHSLTDIEKLNAEISGKNLDKKQTRRKKEGVFYTPNYITKYIVENTIGSLCEDKKKELKLINLEVDKTYTKKGRKGEIIPSQKGEQLIAKLEEYKEWLLSLKIIDPACGSGAFLNQALNFLIDEHNFIINLETDIRRDQLSVFDIDTAVLENNLYGVDINEESVEIAQLSLWLKTAKRGRKLTDLSEHIKCGNSLIDDPEIAGEKAFDWNKQFPEIMQKGGFDVVIGNPPYGDYFSNDEKYFVQNKFQNSFSGTFDIYITFFELALRITKSKGKLCFITPNTFINYNQFSSLRSILIKGNNIEQIISLINVFEDAILDSAIILLTKNQIQKSLYKGLIFKKEVTSLDSSIIPKLNSNSLTNKGFNLNSSKNFNVKKLIKKQPYKLSDVIKITQGITTGCNICFINKKNFFLDNGISETVLRKVLKGKTISRYKIHYDDDYLLYSTKLTNENIQNNISSLLNPFKDKLSQKRETKKGKLPWFCLHWSRNESDYCEPKILIRQTANQIIGVLDIQKYYPIDTLHSLNLKSDIENKENVLLFFLGLLNSKFFRYLYRWKLDEEGKVYPQIKKVNIEWLPIPYYDNVDTFSRKIESIQEIAIYEEEVKNKFLHRLETNFEIKKLSNKMKAFYNYDFKTFISELKRKKIKLTLSQQDEWEEYFNDYKEKINKLQKQIDKTDNKIDQMVYELYGLTKEEIEVVEVNNA